MKLDYSYQQISLLLSSAESNSDAIIQTISFDSRKIINASSTLFVALTGVFKNGHSFINDAYNKGVRHFLVSKKGITSHLENAHEIVVPNTLEALEKLAKNHRERFSCPVVAITGSNGKTTVKEWLSELLSSTYNIAKSPKSYNSRLGIALSLLELSEQTEIGIIEAGVDEMILKKNLIQPTHGILTSFGSAHKELFTSQENHFNEKMSLFEDIDHFSYILTDEQNIQFYRFLKKGKRVNPSEFSTLLKGFPSKDQIGIQNASLAISMALELGVSEEKLASNIKNLSPLALRLESYEGVNGNVILNDTYNLDMDSLKHSLAYQQLNYSHMKRAVVIGLDNTDNEKIKEIEKVTSTFSPIELHIKTPETEVKSTFENTSVLIKGTRKAKMEVYASSLKKYNHQSFLEINLKSIRHNINYYKSLLQKDTKLLCMVKAGSYGSDAKTMGRFLENTGVDYLGVAYPNEGVELRSKGIKLPILVMNCEEQLFAECIAHKLEPAIYSMNQLDSFIRVLINHSTTSYPIHIKLETGMNRLGFPENEIPSLIAALKSQPEVHVRSIYSHLAESDVIDSEYTRRQINLFGLMTEKITTQLPYPVLKHILNTEGITNYNDAQMDMVRLGIGMYGVGENNSLRPAIGLHSSISQIKTVKKGTSIGYGRNFKAEKDTLIAIIPIGYADGLRRSLGNKNGGVYINNRYCPIVGNVCMDMIMVEVKGINCKEGDSVEIIGKNQSIKILAEKMDSITYEVLTSFSSRLHRIYTDQ